MLELVDSRVPAPAPHLFMRPVHRSKSGAQGVTEVAVRIY